MSEEQGTRIIGLHLTELPGDGLALELRKDCPSSGLWTVIEHRATSGEERQFVYSAERQAWAAYWRTEANAWGNLSRDVQDTPRKIEAAANATRAAEMATLWER